MHHTPQTAYLQQLGSRMADRSAVIAIIGLGYAGLPLALCYARAGYRVRGIDVDAGKVERIRRGTSYIGHIGDADMAGAADKLTAATDYAAIAEADAVVICVPTPLDATGQPDLSHVVAAIDAALPYLQCGQVVSLESTSYPGTTEELIRPRVESRGFTVGEDMFLVSSPEREDPGNAAFPTRRIPKVCGGITRACTTAGMSLYRFAVDRVVPVSSARTAEFTKLLENTHRAVNIGLVNEMKMIADRVGVDIHEAIGAAATKPFGFAPYHPGPGVGGHCIPVDPVYLAWKARACGAPARFVDLACEVNGGMPRWVVAKLGAALAHAGKQLMGSRVLVLGVAYKQDIEDTRESPAGDMMCELRTQGALIDYSDPHVPSYSPEGGALLRMFSVALTPEAIASYDAVLITTAHKAFDYALVLQHARLIVDTRGVYPVSEPNVVMA